MATNFKNTAASSLKSLQSSLTKELRADALAVGWPKIYANTLSVRINESNIYIDYPGQMAADIEDLEYGSGDTPPKPLMRLFIDRHARDFENIFAEASINDLFDSGVLP